MTKVHAYLARIKDQEKEVIAVPDGAGRALCVSFDKHWTFTREWGELHIIAPAVEDEGNDDPAVTREEVEKAVKGTLDGWNITLPDNLFDAQIDAVWSLVSEACTAPAVTRANIEKAVAEWVDDAPEVVNEVWSLVSGADPAVFVVRESDIAAVKVEQDEDGYWEANGDLVAMRQNTAEALRGWSLGELQMLARYEAVARAIEAEQAVDPVEAKAKELYWAATPDARWENVADEYRRIARHVLGQEDRHVDQ